MTASVLNAGSIITALILVIGIVYLIKTGRLPNTNRMQELEAVIRVLQSDHVRDLARIEHLEKELAGAEKRIQFLEGQLSRYEPNKTSGGERLLLAVVGSDPMLKTHLSALREVERDGGIVVTRCFPAQFRRFEATLSRYRAGGEPLRLVHFSAHVTAEDGGAILFEEPISGEQLSGVLNGVEVVMVAGCDSDILGDLLGVVPSVVTFRETVRLEHATLAIKLFWGAIGRGLNARDAYRETRRRLPAEVAEFLELRQ